MRTELACLSWRIPDGLWARMESFVHKYTHLPRGGRPRLDLRNVADRIFYVLRTGCQWKAAPKEFGSGSSLHRYFQEWARRCDPVAIGTILGPECLRRNDPQGYLSTESSVRAAHSVQPASYHFTLV